MFKAYDGAIQLMQQALQRTRVEEKRDRAWILTHVGRLLAKKRDFANAAAALNAALALIPEYHYALANLGEIRKAQKNYSAAAELYRRRYESAPHPENLYDFGDALVKAGKRTEARRIFAKFESAALAESQNLDNANRELVLYYVEHARKPDHALRIAELEASRRRDVHTLEVYSKALKVSGKAKEARAALAESEERLRAGG